jgi:iron complex outermembrane receptor protein
MARPCGVAILLAGTPAHLSAQAGVLHGRVVRADQPIGLSDADLVLHPSGITTRSDPRGYFEFRDLAAGPVELSVRRLGFAPVTVVLQVDGVTTRQVDIPLQPAATVLDPIVTSVTRDERGLSQLAAAVSVADSAAIDRGRTVGLHETLRMMPGVQAVSEYGTDQVSIGIRGSGARGPFHLRGLAVLLDGIPVTESDGRTRLDLIELSASRQIEVMRGPASALFAGSSGGVVNVVSRSGRDSPGVSMRALRGASDFLKYDGRAGGVFDGGRGSAFAAGSYTSADGYRDHSDGSNARGQVAFDFLAGPNTRVAVEANVSRLDLRLPGSLTQAQFDADPDAADSFYVTINARRADSRYRAGLRVEQAFSSGIATGYFFYGGRTLYLPDPSGTGLDANFHRPQGGARFRADRVAGSPIEATVGFDYDLLVGTDYGGARGDPQDDASVSVPNLGVYSQAAWQVSQALEFTAGLRYDRVAYHFESNVGIPQQETSYDHLSPRVSARWSADSVTSLYASVGRGTEVPIIGELTPFGFGVPLRTNLRPKSLWNYEVGARRVVDGRVLVEGTVFYADVRNEFVPSVLEGQTVPENARRSRNIGVELGVTARASDRLDLGASYTFLDIRLQDYTSVVLDSTGTLVPVDFSGKLLPGVPQHRITGEVRVRPWAAVDLGMQLEWQSVVHVENGNADSGIWYAPDPLRAVAFRAIPARALVHLDGAWHLGPATLVGTVENLFGLRYANPVVKEFSGAFYEAGPPATVTLGCRFTGWGPGRP